MFCPKKEIMRCSLSFMIIGEGLHRLFFDASQCHSIQSLFLLERIKRKNRMNFFLFVTGQIIETMVCGQVCCQGNKGKIKKKERLQIS